MELKRELEADLLRFFRQGLAETYALKQDEIEALSSMVCNKTVRRKKVLVALGRQEELRR